MEGPRGATWAVFSSFRLSSCGQRMMCFHNVAYPYTTHYIALKNFLIAKSIHLSLWSMPHWIAKVDCSGKCAAVKVRIRLKRKITRTNCTKNCFHYFLSLKLPKMRHQIQVICSVFAARARPVTIKFWFIIDAYMRTICNNEMHFCRRNITKNQNVLQ